MPVSRIFLTTLFSLLFIGGVSTTNADMVTLIPMPGYSTGANVNALAGPLFSSDIASFDIPGPGAGSVSAAKFGNTATHEWGVELDYSAGPAFFDSKYSGFERTSVEGERASAESIFHFSVDSDATYDSMGMFGAMDEVGTSVPGNVELEIELLDITDMGMPPITLFYSYQVSTGTLDQDFFVGGSDGDTTNIFTGTPTGLLMPGKIYRYRTLVTINAIDVDGGGPMPPTDGGATAMGEHVLLIEKAAAVPEPNSIALIGMGLIVIAGVRRRRIAAK